MVGALVVMTDERLWTVAQVAQHLQVTEWTVRQWLNAGKLKGYRLGATKAGWRIPDSALNAFIKGEQSANRDGEA